MVTRNCDAARDFWRVDVHSTNTGREKLRTEPSFLNVALWGLEGSDSSQSSDGLSLFFIQSGNRDGQFGLSSALAEAPQACLQPVWVSD